RVAHVQPNEIALELRADHAGWRFERNLFPGLCDFGRKTREATRAVAAHFGFAAVSVVVTHAKIRAVLRLLDQKNTVGADAAMTIADVRDLFATEPHVAGAIVDHDKIVACAVHLGEAQHDLVDLTQASPVVMSSE